MNKRIGKIIITAAFTAGIGVMISSNANAFSDVGAAQEAAISALQQKGIIQGFDADHYAPSEAMSYAQAVQLIVKAFNLNIDELNFFKEPLASDMYIHVKDHVWYSQAFIVAYYNGLQLDKEIDPNAAISRELFTELLIRALEEKGELPMVKTYLKIADEANITPERQGMVQRLLYYKIATLNGKGNFEPLKNISRGEAAGWIFRAIKLF